MRRLLLAAVVLCGSITGANANNDVGQSIDDFGLPIDLQQPRDEATLNDVLDPVGFLRGTRDVKRLYVAGIVGDSFATLGTPLGPSGNGAGDPSPSPAANQSLFTAGGAIGLAFEALDREWRVEFEGRGRNNLVSDRTSTFDSSVGPETFLFTTTAKNGWSTMVSLWRDYEFTDRWTMYVGGGIGGGGYRFSYAKVSPSLGNYQIATSPHVSAFAWQAGGGTAYAITERITLDIGYRYFQIANGTSTAVISYVPGPPVGSEIVGSAFGASELFFAFRIYEPFRNWR
ncbi:MAG: outer membrane protein [Planctomycetia bacterium]